MDTQSTIIAICRGKSNPLPSSGESPKKKKLNLTNLPINFAAHNILSAKRDSTAQ